ncbi:MAG TPA: HlyD family secretion protein [Candidatus Competibacteraceae bacterium]|nr:HlyD family secretion protein [Candidatus Competibacteraceae bacterium]
MKKILLPLLGLAILVGGGVWGYHWWRVGRFLESTDNAYVQSDIIAISPQVSGYVRELPVVDHQLVEAGTVLAVLDDREYAARVAQAQAAVEAQRAALVSLEARVVLNRSQVEKAEAGVAQARAELDWARKELARYSALVSRDTVSRNAYDQASAAARKAEAALAQAQAELRAAQDETTLLAANRQEILAAQHQAEAQLELARLDLERTVIRAPRDGVVGNRAAQVGQLLKSGAPLMSLVPLPQVYVVANFKETQLARMRPGQPVRLHVDAYPGQSLEGRIDSFAPASGAEFSLLPPENATGNFTKIVQRVPVRIVLPAANPLAGLLRPGLSVEVEVDTRDPGQGERLAGDVFGVAQAATLADADRQP